MKYRLYFLSLIIVSFCTRHTYSQWWSGTGAPDYFIYNNNSGLRVGINTTSPQALLDVSGGDALINGVTIGRGNYNGNWNLALGDFALLSNTSSAHQNIAVGLHVLRSNTSGSYNTAMGTYSMYYNVNGSSNTAIGSSALEHNLYGWDNSAIGALALFWNDYGSYNVANGYGAIENNEDGDYNVGIGLEALKNNKSGSNATAIGTKAMYYANNTTTPFDNFNIALGYEALRGSSTASDNTGNYNLALGYQSLLNNKGGGNNIANGYLSLYSNTSGNYNTGLGNNTLYSNSAGSRATAVGYNAMYYSNNTTTPFDNFNIALGYEALRGSTTASNNNGNYNTAIGYQSILNNSQGQLNTANGYLSLTSNSTGDNNTAIGASALSSNTSGDANTALGYYALQANSTSNGSTANGYQALYQSTGQKNTSIGAGSLSNNISGEKNTAIGYNSDVSSNNLTNSTAVGFNASTNSSNKIRMGDANVTVYETQVAWSVPSDERFKINIQENVPGLEFINKLRPITYNFETLNFDKFLHQDDSSYIASLDSTDFIQSQNIIQSGLIAQEVQTVAEEINYDFSGLHKATSDQDNYSLSYSMFVIPLIRAVQELDSMVKLKDEQLLRQQEEINILLDEFEKIKLELSSTYLEEYIKPNTSENNSPWLGQNIPNPFGNSTIIPFGIPKNAQNASIMITNIGSGKVISVIPITINDNSVNLDAANLPNGMYSYSLIIDGQLIATKELMIMN